MTIHAHVFGLLVGDPQRRQSAKGAAFTTASVRSGSGDEATFISVVAFGDAADRLLQLQRGDAVSVAGRADLRSSFGKDGAQKTGLSIVANEIAAARPRPRPRETAPQRARQASVFDGPPLDEPINDLYARAPV